MKEFIIKELYSFELTSECLNDQSDITDRSTYNFFLTKQEIQQLCQNLHND
jgi:prolyl-tRNA synthetase